MNTELLLRTIKMAEMRDPQETGLHLNRVGAYSAEIYFHWPKAHGLGEEEIQRNKSLLRIAAMLHDVGKVAISDTILKKPSRLSQEEYEKVKLHTFVGAAFFTDPDSDLDAMSAEIALNHHQRWDGRGYPAQNLDPDDEVGAARPLKGSQTSIFARITALADVYDALCARRAYKEPWPEERVLETIKAESNRGFDPEVVDSFLAGYETIGTIRARYPDRRTGSI